MLSFKLSIHDVTANGPINFKEHKAWKYKPKSKIETVTIRAYVYQCKDLPAADSNGSSDPYVKLWDMSGKNKKTKVIEDNTNPLYYETIDLEYEVRDIKDLESYPPFIFDLFDEDAELFDSSDDFLARAIVEPEDCVIEFPNDYKCKQHD
jgi:Ca2+-dependent lipid-binding protein